MKIRAGMIQIFAYPNGNFVYLPAVYHAKPDTPISWVANGNWAVQFPNGTPLREGTSLHGSKEIEVAASIQPEAKGIYHYAVAVEIDGRIVLDAGCPTIIIG